MPGWSISVKNSLPGLQTATFALCPDMAEKERLCSGIPSYMDSYNAIGKGPIFMTSFNRNFLLQTWSHWGLDLQHMNWGVGRGHHLIQEESILESRRKSVIGFKLYNYIPEKSKRIN